MVILGAALVRLFEGSSWIEILEYGAESVKLPSMPDGEPQPIIIYAGLVLYRWPLLLLNAIKA